MESFVLAAGGFTVLDGGIVGLYLLATMIAGIMVRKYVGKVEHFLLAGREMNLYLGIASLAATEFGIVTCMYTAQLGYEHGFAGAWPGISMAMAMLVIGLTGFCVKPLRDAGVMTIPELFENRFGSKVRWAAGVVIVLGGLLNMGMFLRMGGDFLVTVTGLGQATASNAGGLLGFFQAHMLETAMTVLLLMVAVYTILGGMLSVLVTDFLQFVVMSAGLLTVTLLILFHPEIGWAKLVTTAQDRIGDGAFNPFLHPEGPPWVLAQVLLNTAAVLTWQTTIQRLLAAKDTRTGQRIYTRTSFFFVCRFMIPGLWGLAALAWLRPEMLTGIPAGDVSKFAMPVFLNRFLPWGLMGILVAAMLAADMSTDSAYMLTWGSVIYNDIMAPIHKRKWPEKKGLLWSRCIVALIGLFLLFFGLWYKLEGNLWAYLVLTGTIYLASMSTLLVACCYWKRANSWGAAEAIVAGAVIPLGYLTLNLVWRIPRLDQAGNAVIENGQPATMGYLAHHVGESWPVIAAFAASILAMIVGSLLKPKSPSATRA